MARPSRELRQWQDYVKLFENANDFVNSHTETPCDPVVLDPSVAPWYAEDVRRSLAVPLGRLSTANHADLLGEVTVARTSKRRWVPLGPSMYDGDAVFDDYSERLTISHYTAAEQPELVQSYTIGFYDEWADYHRLKMIDPPPKRKLGDTEVLASDMIKRLDGTDIAKMRQLLDSIIAAASTTQQIQQYPYISPPRNTSLE